jgi:hypothetical protein
MLTARTDGNNIGAGLFLMVEPALLFLSLLTFVGMALWILTASGEDQFGGWGDRFQHKRAERGLG